MAPTDFLLGYRVYVFLYFCICIFLSFCLSALYLCGTAMKFLFVESILFVFQCPSSLSSCLRQIRFGVGFSNIFGCNDTRNESCSKQSGKPLNAYISYKQLTICLINSDENAVITHDMDADTPIFCNNDVNSISCESRFINSLVKGIKKGVNSDSKRIQNKHLATPSTT